MNEQKIDEQVLTFNDLFFLIKRNILLIVILTLFTTSVAGVYGLFFKQITYTASTTIIIEVDPSEVNDNPGSAIQASQLLMNTYKDYILTQPVLTASVQVLEEQHTSIFDDITKEYIKNSVDINVSTSSLIIVISCSTNDPEKSIAIANTLVQCSSDIANELTENGDPKFKSLANRIKIMEEAYDSVASRGAAIVIVIGALVGLVLSFSVILVIYLTDNTYSSKKIFEESFGINILTCLREAENEGV